MAASGVGIPGPRWPALAQTAAFVAAPGAFLERCSARYGPAFTLRFAGEGPAVWLIDERDVRAALAAPADAGVVNWQLADAVGERSILLLDGDEHLALRRRLSPAFHGEALREAVAVIDAVARDHVARWPRDVPFAVRPRAQQLTLEAILRAVLGAAEPTVVRAMTQWLALAGSPVALVPALRRDLGPWWPYRRFLRARARVRQMLAARRDRFAPLAGLDEDDAVDQLVTLLVAGHETTATALAWALHDLARTPERQDPAAVGSLAREALQAHPPIPMVGRRLREPLALQDGRRVPAGAVVNPALLLDGTHPFGGGSRRCLGAAFATAELEAVLRAVLSDRDVRPAARRPEHERFRAIVLGPRRGGRVVLATRRRPRP